MKPTSHVSDETSPGFIRSHTFESNDIDCCTLNVYEFQEGEELYGPRSRGYQKPKHMWMAKDQALTTSKPASPSVAPTTMTTKEYCANQVAITSTSTNNSCCSPQLTCTYESPFVTSNTGLSVALSSCTNTNGTLCNHTPDNGTNFTEGVSSCVSSSSGELPPNKSDFNNIDARPGIVTKVNIRDKLTSKSKSNKRLGSSELKKINCLAADSTSQGSKHQKSTRLVNSKRKNRKLPMDEKMMNCTSSDRSDGTCCSEPTQTNPSDQPGKQSPEATRLSRSLPCTSPIVTGGLKIRLRRDSTPLDINIGRSKRVKSKSSSSIFRIVESWCDADAPGGDYSRRARAVNGNSSSPTFNLTSGSLRVGDIVWAKLAGYPYWPSQISAIWARTAHQLSQATLLPTSQPLENGNSSLAVLATPSDSSLAAGYTARVDWLAWDQCSYLSCAKLYPFKEAFDKLYNPRTRVKGYADAVRLAKQFVNGAYVPSENTDSLSNLSPQNKSHSFTCQISAPPSTDSQWSAMTAHSSSFEAPVIAPKAVDLSDKNNVPMSCVPNVTTYTTSQAVPAHSTDSNIFHNGVTSMNNPFSAAGSSCDGVDDKHMDLPDLGSMPMWTPLPQLDVSGLGVFHVPTFSEDEEELDQSIVNQLELDFGSCM